MEKRNKKKRRKKDTKTMKRRECDVEGESRRIAETKKNNDRLLRKGDKGGERKKGNSDNGKKWSVMQKGKAVVLKINGRENKIK